MAYGYSVRKADDNQKAIAEAFRRLKFSYHHTHQLGKGFPDGIAGRSGLNYLIEIKDGSKVESKRKLTPDEQKFHETWLGQVVIIESVTDVINFSKVVK